MSKNNLLKEELKRHMQLLEYTFYMGDEYQESDKGEDGKEDDLILGGEEYLDEQEDVPEEEPAEVNPFDAPPEDAPEGEEIEAPEGEEVSGEEESTEGGDPFGAEEVEIEDEFATEPAETGEETVEIDVTDIVDKAEATRSEIEGITSKMDDLMGNFEELSTQVTGMDQVIDKIENLEKEIEKRKSYSRRKIRNEIFRFFSV